MKRLFKSKFSNKDALRRLNIYSVEDRTPRVYPGESMEETIFSLTLKQRNIPPILLYYLLVFYFSNPGSYR